MRTGWLPLVVAGLAACSVQRSPAGHSASIIGGVLDPGHPYVVGTVSSLNAKCNGVVIGKRTVLTVAHCGSSISKIRLGGDLTGTPTEIAVSATTLHPAYSGSPGYSSDLAILTLAADAPVQAVPLLRETMTNTPGTYTTTPCVRGPDYTFVGYGYETTTGTYGMKRAARFPINFVGPGLYQGSQPVDATQLAYDSLYEGVALSTGKNQCVGDSGGATFLVRNKVERLAGIISLGDAACVYGTSARADLSQMTFIQGQLDAIEGTADNCRQNGVCQEGCAFPDPDCAENHCGADSVCSQACVQPVDPDCPVLNHCAADGVCDPSCAVADPDCSTGASDGGSQCDMPPGASDALPGDATTSAADGGTASDLAASQADLAGPPGTPSEGGCQLGGAAAPAGSSGMMLLGLLFAGLVRRRARSSVARR